jgi:hypothetical protein
MRWRERIVELHIDYILCSDRRVFKNVAIRDPRHYFSDHFAIMGILVSEPMRVHRTYLGGRKRFPLYPPKWGPRTKKDMIYEEIKGYIGKRSRLDCVWTPWISDKLWRLVDHRAELNISVWYSRRESCWELNPGPSEASTRARDKDCRSYDLQPVKGKEWILCSRGMRGNEESPKKQFPSSSHFFKII